jgi:hypothetical protein
MNRKLSPIEEQFKKEAIAGNFGFALDDEGFPFALGAVKTDNLFSMEVKSSWDAYGALYTLPDAVIDEILEQEKVAAMSVTP